VLLVFLAPGIGLLHSRPVLAEQSGNVLPESGGGGGGYGDPDQPQEPPKMVVGGDPEYTVYNPSDPGVTYSGHFGGAQVVGRNTSSVWKWRLRILIAGLRSYYLRF
jgi:hypothetical protein